MNKVFKNIILIICICGICYFSYNIINYYLEENESKNLNKELKAVAMKTDINYDKDQIQEKQLSENTIPVGINFDNLKRKNDDIIGWIFMENSIIDFPVVQSEDNEYYLRRLIDGSYNRAGTIFMDFRNNKDFSDEITIIYGHNMKNNTMFGSLLNFKNQSYYDNHKKMYFYTAEKKYEIDLIAGYTENADAPIFEYPSTGKNKNDIIKNAISKSTFVSNIEFLPENRFIALSTCSYEYDEARYILIGVIRDN